MHHPSSFSCACCGGLCALGGNNFSLSEWWNMWYRLHQITRHVWRGVSTSQGFHSDVGCWRMMVGRIDCSWCTYFAIRRMPFAFWGTSGCFCVQCSVIPAVVIWRAARIPVFPRGFVGDVTWGLLASGADILFPLSLGPGSSRVNSPSPHPCSPPSPHHRACQVITPPTYAAYCNRYVQLPRTILTILRLDVRLVCFFSDLLPPNWYVQLPRTILTILRLDVRLVFCLATPFRPSMSFLACLFYIPRVPFYQPTTPLTCTRAASFCRLLRRHSRYVTTTEIRPSRITPSLGAILVPLFCTRSPNNTYVGEGRNVWVRYFNAIQHLMLWLLYPQLQPSLRCLMTVIGDYKKTFTSNRRQNSGPLWHASTYVGLRPIL